MKKTELFENVNARIIQLMQENGQEWAKGWADKYVHNAPRNIVSNKPYSGFNSFITYCAPYESPIWGTYKQWQEKGAQVKKGEKATHIIYASKFLPKDQKNLPENEQKTAFCLKPYAIFNSEQTDYEMPELELNPIQSSADVHADAEVFVSNTGAIIQHLGNSAFYSPMTDSITMPPLEQFFTTSDYYGTLLHELTHWTRHKTRLNRSFNQKRFGDSGYAQEELVAELSSALLCAMIGIDAEPRADHAKYINNWIQAINDNESAMLTAFSHATKAVEFLESLQNRKEEAA
jgi:antirestriction protein ArdC